MFVHIIHHMKYGIFNTSFRSISKLIRVYRVRNNRIKIRQETPFKYFHNTRSKGNRAEIKPLDGLCTQKSKVIIGSYRSYIIFGKTLHIE